MQFQPRFFVYHRRTIAPKSNENSRHSDKYTSIHSPSSIPNATTLNDHRFLPPQLFHPHLHSTMHPQEKFPRKNFCVRVASLGFDVTFWACAGMRTEICEAAEKFANEIFRASRENNGVTLIFNSLNVRRCKEILPEDLEYKNCPIDLTLTGMWSQHSMDVARICSTTNCC
jgi:hypothetical protein